MNRVYVAAFYDELEKLGALGWPEPMTAFRRERLMPRLQPGARQRIREAEKTISELIKRHKTPIPAMADVTGTVATKLSKPGLLRRAATRVLTKGRAG
jgi:hypothetical protein